MVFMELRPLIAVLFIVLAIGGLYKIIRKILQGTDERREKLEDAQAKIKATFDLAEQAKAVDKEKLRKASKKIDDVIETSKREE